MKIKSIKSVNVDFSKDLSKTKKIHLYLANFWII